MPTAKLIKNRSITHYRREPLHIFSIRTAMLVFRLILFFIAMTLSYVLSFVVSIIIYIIYFLLYLIGYD